MNYLAIAIILFASIAVTVQRGPGATFTYIFLPVILLVSLIPSVALPVLPDMTSTHAVTYGVLLGMLIVGKLPAFRLHPIDLIIALISMSSIATGYVNGNMWTIVSSFGSETLHWLVPYYMARLAFREVLLRRHMAILLATLAIGLASVSLIEWRLRPLVVGQTMNMLRLSTVDATFVQGRFGFFRAMVTGEHPIDFGNIGILLAAMIPALAITGGLRLRDKRILLGTLAAFGIILTSMSFSSFSGAIAALGIFVGLRYVYRSEVLLVPAVITMIVTGILVTGYFLEFDLSTMDVGEESAQIEGSFYTRVEIIQKSWNTYGTSAGVLGYGDNVKGKEMSLKSVDNSYMLFLINRGWGYLVLRFVLILSVAFVATRMLLGQRGESARVPIAAIVAAIIGIMVSMYTVWFGFIYAVLWTCLVGMLVSMRQVMLERAAVPVQPVGGLEPAFAPRHHPMPVARSPVIARAADLR